jgi:(2Fe-2S) ferredoxin
MGKHSNDQVVKVEKLVQSKQPCLGICAGKHCAKSGAKHVIRAVQAALAEAGLDKTIVCKLTKCQDYCDDGPAMTVIPGVYPYVDLSPDSARQVVFKHVRDGYPVHQRLHKRFRRKLERRLA